MASENKNIQSGEIVSTVTLSLLIGIILWAVLFVAAPKYLGSSGRVQYMQEQGIKLAQKELQMKYGEEFIIRNVYSESPSSLYVHCSPASDEDVVFRAEIWRDGRGVAYDEYIEGIIAREIEKEIEDELKNTITVFLFRFILYAV
ncbi:MAG: hypothetical protein NC092_07315 [Butyrivibrio sp.]|nr:hypothetical protein [Muribaculum sp.]MCM1552486.1 hypothetical protein [Butyrivibrio sp.]